MGDLAAEGAATNPCEAAEELSGANGPDDTWSLMEISPVDIFQYSMSGVDPQFEAIKNGRILVETEVISKISLEKVLCGLNLVVYSLLQAGILIGTRSCCHYLRRLFNIFSSQ